MLNELGIIIKCFLLTGSVTCKTDYVEMYVHFLEYISPC